MNILLLSLTVLLITKTAVLGQLIECFDTCGSGAISLGLSEGINECCSSTEGSAFIDLKIANIVGCQSCIDIETLGPKLEISSSVSGNSVTLTCSVRIAASSNFSANLQWLGPDQSVLQQMLRTPTLDLELTAITEFGAYTCVATITSPDFIGIEATVSASLPISKPQSNCKNGPDCYAETIKT